MSLLSNYLKMKKLLLINVRNGVLTGASSENIVKGVFEVPEGLFIIGDMAFDELIDLKRIVLNDVNQINEGAFRKSGIEKFHSGNVKVIKALTFQDCYKLKDVELTDDVEEICFAAFQNCFSMKKFNFPKNLKRIGPLALENCSGLNELIFENPVDDIHTSAFLKCDNINYIKYGEYEHFIDEVNKFDRIKAVNGILIISELDDLYKPLLTVTNGFDAERIDTSIFGNIDETLNNLDARDLIDWKNIFTFKNGNVDYDILRRIDDGIILNVSPSRENANLIRQGISHYEDVKNVLKAKPADNKNIFKMCYSLGVFSGDNEHVNYVKQFLLNEEVFNIDYIKEVFEKFDLSSGFNKNKALLLIKSLNDNEFRYNPDWIARINNDYFEMKKFIEKEYKEIIGKELNTRFNFLKKRNVSTNLLKFLKKEMEDMKSSIKKIELKDVKYFLENSIFEIRSGNEELKAIVNDLRNLDQDDFDRIQGVYEHSKTIEKELICTRDFNNGYTYQWSAGDNPINLVLGNLLQCCFKVNGAGEDIMIQSMINPFVQNLLIRDENQNIVAKATCYYNKRKKYLLFNNVEARETVKKEEAKKAIMRAVNDQIEALKEVNVSINSVRMGMDENDVFDDNSLVVLEKGLLANYPYERYRGNAVKKQGILYEKGRVLRKN